MQLSFEKQIPDATNVPPRSRYAWLSDEEWSICVDSWRKMVPQPKRPSSRHKRYWR